MTDAQPTLDALVAIAEEAASIVMTYYRSPELEVIKKDDGSPVTEADKAANAFIVEELSRRWTIPILTEESAPASWSERTTWTRWWLVDPLDGTRDFIARTDEFGVNIALVEDGRPVLGVIAAPALKTVWWAARGEGSFVKRDGNTARLSCRGEGSWTGLRSRYYATKKVDAFMRDHGIEDIRTMGSTIKLCLIAEGDADVYMSPGRSNHWDTAPGQLIIEEAGGLLLTWPECDVLHYRREELENPALVACSKRFYDRMMRDHGV